MVQQDYDTNQSGARGKEKKIDIKQVFVWSGRMVRYNQVCSFCRQNYKKFSEYKNFKGHRHSKDKTRHFRLDQKEAKTLKYTVKSIS